MQALKRDVILMHQIESYPMDKISVVIYEDNVRMRDSLCEVFEYENDFELKGAFENCNSVESEMENLHPDIVLMDKEMPGTDGLQGLKLIKSNFPDVDVVMLTGLEDDETIFKCLQSGASGYIKKGTPYLQLLEYIRIVHSGGTMFSPSIASRVRDFFRYGPPQNKDAINLTPKEKEALTFLCDGLSNKLIAEKMYISVDGVGAHLKNIFRKLQVNSAPEAVSKSLRMRLIESDKLKYE